MSVFDGRRLPSAVFKLDTQRLPSGWYSDKYFLNIAEVLRDLASDGYSFEGHGRAEGPGPRADPHRATSRSRCNGSRAASHSA